MPAVFYGLHMVMELVVLHRYTRFLSYRYIYHATGTQPLFRVRVHGDFIKTTYDTYSPRTFSAVEKIRVR